MGHKFDITCELYNLLRQYHTGKAFRTCSECGKICGGAGAMKSHMKVHTSK